MPMHVFFSAFHALALKHSIQAGHCIFSDLQLLVAKKKLISMRQKKLASLDPKPCTVKLTVSASVTNTHMCKAHAADKALGQ